MTYIAISIVTEIWILYTFIDVTTTIIVSVAFKTSTSISINLILCRWREGEREREEGERESEYLEHICDKRSYNAAASILAGVRVAVIYIRFTVDTKETINT